MRTFLHHSAHQPPSAALCPVSTLHAHHLNAWVVLHHRNETLMTFPCRRRAFQSSNLQHLTLATQSRCHKLGKHTSHLHVVGTDESSIFFRISLSVKQNHRNPAVVSLINNRGNGMHLIRRHDQQIDSLRHKLINLANLQFVIIVCRYNLQFHLLIVEVGAHFHLVVQLFAPYILTALRHGNHILLPFPCA